MGDFSFSMCAQIYAMMRNGGASYEKLRIFCKGCVADNGFNLNGDYKRYGFSQWHYRPFTLEGLFGYCDALQEMLLQDHNGFIEVFPAIPEEWQKKVSFKNLRSYKGVLVSASYKDGKPCKVVLKSRRKNTVELLNNFGCDNLIVQRKNETLTVNVKQGETVKIELDGRAVTIQAQA